MKFLKGLLTTLLSIVLFFAIFGFSVTIVTKNVLQERALPDIIKNELIPQAIEEKEIKLTEEQKEVVYRILEDKKTTDMINLVVNNFIKYESDEDYELDEKDAKEIKKFILQYKEEIKKYSNGEVTDEQIEEYLTYENMSEAADVLLEKMATEISDEDVDMKNAITVYDYATSAKLKNTLLGAIIVIIILITLINLPKYTSMTAIGVVLIISGIFVSCIYCLFGVINELIKEAGTNMSLSSVSGVDRKSVV